MIRSIQHIALTLPKPDIARTFYSTFGLETKEEGGRIIARCQGRDQNQVVVSEGSKRGLEYVSFAGKPSELADTRARLESRGVKLLDAPRAGAPEGIWFRDPDGNLIHLGGEASAKPRASAPVALNAPGNYVRQNERGCPPFGLEPKPLRLMHIILFSPDPARQVKFYTENLGMKLTDYVADGFVNFMRGASDGDHHLLGILKSDHPGLHHASFEMESLDHIQLGARRVIDAGYQHVWGTGRHTVGSNFFHYFRDPWGTLAEYSFDIDFIPEGAHWECKNWPKEQGLFLWSSDGPPPPEFPKNLVGAG